MKKLYVAHILALFMLFFLGTYFLNAYYNMQLVDVTQRIGLVERVDYGQPGKYYGICSLFFFAFSIIVGLQTMPRLRKTGAVLILGGFAFIGWSCLVIASPGHININEFFPAWVAYIVIAIGLSIYGILVIDKVELINTNFDDQLLDDNEIL